MGTKMIIEGINKKAEETVGVGLRVLFIQRVVTSIDALSVGFAIEEYSAVKALLCAFIISVITFIICFSGLIIGKNLVQGFLIRLQYLEELYLQL